MELDPWPYSPFPSASDEFSGNVRYIVQHTEDGYYGFAFKNGKEAAHMIGPQSNVAGCKKKLAELVKPD